MNDPIDDLEAKLTQAARRRHATRRHSRRWRWGVGVVVAVSVAVPAAASVDLLNRIRPAAPPNSTPASTPAIAARTGAAGGGELRVAAYRNREGRLCAALGAGATSAQLVDRRGTEVPFNQVGDCTMRPDPVAAKVVSQFDDPTTPGDERSLVVWGLAAHNVEAIEVVVGDERRVSTPGRHGAFIAAFPPKQGDIVLTIRRSNGNAEKLVLRPAPNLDDLSRRLKKGQIPRHAQGGP